MNKLNTFNVDPFILNEGTIRQYSYSRVTVLMFILYTDRQTWR